MAEKLIIISAPSGGGKTTLCEKLLSEFSGKLLPSVSATTRAPRKNEEDGRDYFFISKDSFEEKIKKDDFAEWAVVHGHYYGTQKKTIEEAFSRGCSVLLDIDVQGAESLWNSFPSQCLSVFLMPPNQAALEKRLRERGTDSEKEVQKRLAAAQFEMKKRDAFDHVIVNDEVEEAYQTLRALIQKEVFGNLK